MLIAAGGRTVPSMEHGGERKRKKEKKVKIFIILNILKQNYSFGNLYLNFYFLIIY